MATTSINPTSLVGSPNVPGTRRFNDLKSEDFFGLLIAQLQNQDPLKPTDNQQLLEQMSMIRQMEQSTNLNKSLEALAGEQRFGAVSGLIGQYVAGHLTDSAGQEVTVQGLVLGVTFNRDGSAVLQLHNGKRLPAKQVDEVTLVENLPKALRDQLAAELAQLNGGTTPGGTTPPATTPPAGTGGTPPVPSDTPVAGLPDGNVSDTARLRAADQLARSRLMERLLSGRQTTADALNSLFEQSAAYRN